MDLGPGDLVFGTDRPHPAMDSIAGGSPEIVTGLEEDRQAASACNLNRHDHFGTRRPSQRTMPDGESPSGIVSAAAEGKAV